MSTPEDMAACECRNAEGYPMAGDSFRGYKHTEVDNSVNGPLPWIAIAMLLSGLSIAIALWAISDARDARTQLLLLREDIRQMTIEAVKHGKD